MKNISYYNSFFVIFSLLQTWANLKIYSGLWHVVYLWIGIASVLFVLFYNGRNNKIMETGIALFIIHSFKVFDRDMVLWDFIWVHVLVFSILLYLLIGIYNKTIQPPRKDLFNLSLLLFAGLGLISTLCSICIYAALQQYLVLLDFLIGTFIIANYFKKESQFRFLVNIFFLIAITLIGLAALKFMQIFSNLIYRIRIDQIHPNSIAGYFNAVILLVMPFCLTVKKIIMKILYSLFIIILLVFSLITFSKLGLFSLMFCLILFLIIMRRKRRQSALEIRFVAAIILLSFAVFIIPQINLVLAMKLLNAGANNANFYNCLVTLKAIKNNMFLGVGFNNNYFLANYGDIPFLNSKGYDLRLEQTQALLNASPHSLFLGIRYYLGICGLISFFIIIFIAIKNAWSVINQQGDSYQLRITLGCFLAMVSMLIHGIMAMTFHFTVWPVVFWVMIGIIMAVRNSKIEDKPLAINNFALKVLILFILLLGISIVIFPILSENYYKAGIQYAKNGKLELAIKTARKAIALNPINPEYFLFLRDIYIRNNMKDDAIGISKKLIKLKKYYAPYYVKLGELYSESGLHNMAIEELKKAVKFDKLGAQEGEHYSKLIALYIQLDMIKEASDLYKDAVKLIPSFKRSEFVKYLTI